MGTNVNPRCATPAKCRYATPQAAERAARRLAFFAGGRFMRAYLCPCDWWHLTRRYCTPLPAESAVELAAERIG
jgi:hypothetical protein